MTPTRFDIVVNIAQAIAETNKGGDSISIVTTPNISARVTRAIHNTVDIGGVAQTNKGPDYSDERTRAIFDRLNLEIKERGGSVDIGRTGFQLNSDILEQAKVKLLKK